MNRFNFHWFLLIEKSSTVLKTHYIIRGDKNRTMVETQLGFFKKKEVLCKKLLKTVLG